MSSKVANRCKAIAKSTGEPCKAAPTANGFCYFHAHPEKASELGRKGGKNKRRRETETFEEWLSALGDAEAIHEASHRIIAACLSEDFPIDRGMKMVALLKSLLRARARRRSDIFREAMDAALQGPYQEEYQGS